MDENTEQAETISESVGEMILCCPIRRRCIMNAVDDPYGGLSEDMIRPLDPLKIGEHLFSAGDAFRAVFVVKSGCVKTEVTIGSGRRQVTGFFLPGDLLGVTAIGSLTHDCDAVATRKSDICEMPYEKLKAFCSCDRRLQNELFLRLGEALRMDRNGWAVWRNESAEKRVLFFFHQLLKRASEPGQSAETTVVSLPMRKEDIANFLGLKPESLSRTLAKLNKQGIIRNRARSFEILNGDALKDPLG